LPGSPPGLVPFRLPSFFPFFSAFFIEVLLAQSPFRCPMVFFVLSGFFFFSSPPPDFPFGRPFVFPEGTCTRLPFAGLFPTSLFLVILPNVRLALLSPGPSPLEGTPFGTFPLFFTFFSRNFFSRLLHHGSLPQCSCSNIYSPFLSAVPVEFGAFFISFFQTPPLRCPPSRSPLVNRLHIFHHLRFTGVCHLLEFFSSEFTLFLPNH